MQKNGIESGHSPINLARRKFLIDGTVAGTTALVAAAYPREVRSETDSTDNPDAPSIVDSIEFLTQNGMEDMIPAVVSHIDFQTLWHTSPSSFPEFNLALGDLANGIINNDDPVLSGWASHANALPDKEAQRERKSQIRVHQNGLSETEQVITTELYDHMCDAFPRVLFLFPNAVTFAKTVESCGSEIDVIGCSDGENFLDVEASNSEKDVSLSKIIEVNIHELGHMFHKILNNPSLKQWITRGEMAQHIQTVHECVDEVLTAIAESDSSSADSFFSNYTKWLDIKNNIDAYTQYAERLDTYYLSFRPELETQPYTGLGSIGRVIQHVLKVQGGYIDMPNDTSIAQSHEELLPLVMHLCEHMLLSLPHNSKSDTEFGSLANTFAHSSDRYVRSMLKLITNGQIHEYTPYDKALEMLGLTQDRIVRLGRDTIEGGPDEQMNVTLKELGAQECQGKLETNHTRISFHILPDSQDATCSHVLLQTWSLKYAELTHMIIPIPTTDHAHIREIFSSAAVSREIVLPDQVGTDTEIAIPGGHVVLQWRKVARGQSEQRALYLPSNATVAIEHETYDSVVAASPSVQDISNVKDRRCEDYVVWDQRKNTTDRSFIRTDPRWGILDSTYNRLYPLTEPPQDTILFWGSEYCLVKGESGTPYLVTSEDTSFFLSLSDIQHMQSRGIIKGLPDLSSYTESDTRSILIRLTKSPLGSGALIYVAEIKNPNGISQPWIIHFSNPD